MVVVLEEERATRAHDAVHPALVAHELQPVVPEARAQSEGLDVLDLEDVGSDHDAGGELAVSPEVLVGLELLGRGQVLDGGDAALPGFLQDRACLDEASLEGDREYGSRDEVESRTCQESRELAIRVLHDLAVGR